MLKRLLLVLLIVILVVVGVIELFLPPVVAKEMAAGLQQMLGTGDSMTVRLRSFPALRMLTGHLGDVVVLTTNVPAGSLTLDSLAVTLAGVSVNMRDLLARKGLKVSHAAGAKAVITISQANLERFLLEGETGLRDPTVIMTPEGLSLSGYLVVAGQEVPVGFSGRFVLRDTRWVDFELVAANVANAEVPDEFLSTFLNLVGSPELALDLSQFPLPLEGTAVKQEEGRLVVEGTSP